jgi:hypothetical protein
MRRKNSLGLQFLYVTTEIIFPVLSLQGSQIFLYYFLHDATSEGTGLGGEMNVRRLLQEIAAMAIV